MKISVVTAVYNRAETISDTLKSIQQQTFEDFEHIIQDGGSTDSTLDIVNQCKTQRMDVISEPDDGIYDAINRGLRRATGDVIGLLHSDDVFASETALQEIETAFAPGIDGVYGDLNYVSSDNLNHVLRRWRSGTYHPSKLRKGWMPPHPTLYLRREVFDQWGYYDPEMKIAADYDAMLRWLIKGQIRLAYVPKVLVNMRVGGVSNRSVSQIFRKSREDYTAIRRNGAGGLKTLALKNLTKIHQFFPRNN
jgi:glycosyltransferase involved in cell wall biosynthesis